MKIVCAVDFTARGEAAARVAVGLAERTRGSVELVHVTHPRTADILALSADAPVLEEAVVADVEARLAVQAAKLAAAGVPVTYRVCQGEIEPSLVARADEIGADLIVTGTHARAAWQRFLVGSVGEATVRIADRPILCVPPGVEALGAPSARLRVTVAVDGHAASGGAIAFVRRLRAVLPCDVVFCRLYWAAEEFARLGLEGPRELFVPDPDVVADLEGQLRRDAGVLPGEGSTTFLVKPAWGEPAGRILELARIHGSDLLVVGAESHHGWGRLSAPAVASRIAHLASGFPVVFVPPEREVDAGAAAPQIFSVLAPTDLSPTGNRAIPFAYRLLAASGGVVELCHIHERPLATPLYAYTRAEGRLTDAERKRIEAQLQALIPSDAAGLGITTHVTVIDGGRAAEAIAQAAERLGVDAVVLASHGKGRAFRALLGSISRSVAETARRPVLIVPSPER